MKKRMTRQKLLISFTAFFVVSLLVFTACNKDHSSDVQDKSSAIENAHFWFTTEITQNENNRIGWSSERIKEFSAKVLWNDAKEYGNGLDNYVVAAIEEERKPFDNKNFEAARCLVFYKDASGAMRMDFIEMLSEKNQMLEGNITDIAANAFYNKQNKSKRKIGNINASILFYDKYYYPESSFQIKNGLWTSALVALTVKKEGNRVGVVSTMAQRISEMDDCQTRYLIGYWYDTNTGEVISAQILYSWNPCEEQAPSYGGGSSSSYAENQSYGRLCQNYNFTTVGDSYTGTVTNIKFTYRSPQGIEYPTVYPESCLSIVNYNINQAQASIIFNEAFNWAKDYLIWELNVGITTAIQIQGRLKNLVQGKLAELKPGSTWSAIGNCSGSIASTNITAGSYCP